MQKQLLIQHLMHQRNCTNDRFYVYNGLGNEEMIALQIKIHQNKNQFTITKNNLQASSTNSPKKYRAIMLKIKCINQHVGQHVLDILKYSFCDTIIYGFSFSLSKTSTVSKSLQLKPKL
jgi:hypothetical protein